MAIFNEVLKACLNKNVDNISVFANKCGVGRTYLHNLMKNGTPTEEVFQKILSALPIPPNEKDELKESYIKCKDGEFLFNQRKQIKDLINRMYVIQEDTQQHSVGIETYQRKDAEQEVEVIHGILSINHFIDGILSQTVHGENPHIRFVMPYDYTFFFDNLFLKYSKNPAMQIECLFEFSIDTDIVRKKHNVNIDIIQSLMPFIMKTSGNFTAHYQYSLNPAKYVSTAPMPYFFSVPGGVVAISADLQTATVTRNTDIIQSYNKIFDEMKSKGQPLIERINSLKDSIEFYAQSENTKISGISGFGSHPCIAIYYDRETLETHIPLEIPNREQMVEITMTIYKNMKDYAKMGGIPSYFTLDGFDLFVREGIIETIAEGFFKAFTPSERAEIIKKMINDTESGLMDYRVINTYNIKVPPCFYIDVFGKSHINLVIGSPAIGEEISTIKIDEPSIVEAFRDFLKTFIDTDMVYSKEDTLKALNGSLCFLSDNS